MSNPEDTDPAKHFKRLKKVFGVSEKLQRVAQRRADPTTILKSEHDREVIQSGKEFRKNRLAKVSQLHLYIFEIVADMLNVDTEEVMAGVLDDNAHMDLIESIFAKNGAFAIIFSYGNMVGYPLDSGRCTLTNRNAQVKRVTVLEGHQVELNRNLVVVYRTDNSKIVETKTITQDYFILYLGFSSDETALSVIKDQIKEVITSQVKMCKDQSMSNSYARDQFNYAIDTFNQFLTNTHEITKKRIIFDVSHDLYKGFLLAKFQIEETARNRSKVELVEKYFSKWMKQIENALNEGKQIIRHNYEDGPLQLLEHWRRLLSLYTSIVEFTSSQAFINHCSCLVISRSTKLIKRWKEIDNQVTIALNESKDNVRYISSLQRFWAPLYRTDLKAISRCLPGLLSTIRNLCKSATFFNTSDNATGLHIKILNQLMIACRKYLTENDNSSMWNIAHNDLLNRIQICNELFIKYKLVFYKTSEDMKLSNEKPFQCSPIFIFCSMEKFLEILKMVTTIIETKLTYSILDKIRINGMDQFYNQIVAIYERIVSLPYNILDFRKKIFREDFKLFIKDIESVENEMEHFLKIQVLQSTSSESMLLVLKRFEKLNLDCLCMDRRYLEMAMLLKKEIIRLKDVYNEERANPPIPKNMPPIAGRIKWARSLFQKIDFPMKALKERSCVISHEKCQKTIKYYNYLAGILKHYEMTYHKAWYDFAEEVRDFLHLPVISRNNNRKQIRACLHESVFQLIKEAENMWKLNLNLPDVAILMEYCKNKVLHSKVLLESMVKRNEAYRNSISSVFANIMRSQLKEIEIAFKPGLSTVTWVSEGLMDYINNINMILTNAEDFYKTIIDIETYRIIRPMETIKDASLLYFPENPKSPKMFVEHLLEQRSKAEVYMEEKSITAERGVIDLINMFVEKMNFSMYDSKGRRNFQVPLEELNEENWRTESQLPVDKFDWIQFDQINRIIQVPFEQQRQKLCFQDYEYTKYEFKHFQMDCMDLFSYYNNKMINSLTYYSKQSLEDLKKRISNIENHPNSLDNSELNPILITNMELYKDSCIINPNLDEMQQSFQTVMQSALEVHYFVTAWGKQAKTATRKLRKTTIDEIRHERTFYKAVSEHKDIGRILQNFPGSLLMLRPVMEDVLKASYDEHKYLWSTDREEQLENFLKHNPLLADIKEKFYEYENQTNNLLNLDRFMIIGPIQINLDKVIGAYVEESKKWRNILGELLYVKCKEELNNIVEFITDTENILNKPINDLDDVRMNMECLEKTRENFIIMDTNILNIVETYNMLISFEINDASTDLEKIDGLRLSFNRMLENSMINSRKISEMQTPLLDELMDGVSAFNKEVIMFDNDFELKGPMVKGIPAKEASDRVFLFQNQFEEIWRKYEIYSSGEKLFGLPLTDYTVLHNRKKDFDYLNKLYSLYNIVLKTIDEYYETPWNEVNIEKITAELQDFQIRCRKLPRGMQNWQAYIDLKKKIDDFNTICPLIELMTNEAMKDRHWKQLSDLLKTSLDYRSAKFTLEHIFEAPVLKYQDEVEDICVGAIKELDVEAKLKQITADWSTVNLQLANFKTRGELLLKGQETLDIIVTLEDSLMVINALAANRYNTPFKKDINNWLSKIVTTAEVLDKWLMVQNLWIYLEAVFVGGDIAKQLPQEAKRFANIDKNYAKIMYRATDILNVIECCTIDDTMTNMLPFLLQQIEICQKSLTGYLESKRLIFPRFFFVSDPVLLEILGQASVPKSIQPHLLSIFDAIAEVNFQDKTTDVIASINSSNKEKVNLENSVHCTGGVEIWLGNLLKEMQNTIKAILANIAITLLESEFNFVTDTVDFCGQARLVGLQLLWTRGSEYALRKCKTDKKIMLKTNQKFLSLLNQLIELTVKDLSSLDRLIYETMITIHVHQRDIFDELCRLRIKSVYDFEWQKQARFYYNDNNDDIIISITNVNFVYQNEYLGVTERLAITPLTDRCYITLAQAIGMSMGGAPAGPAGTGKTETTKDMGKTLGKLVVVFNCSDQMDFRGLGRIYKGLAQSGSWGCFDEFNRIELPVLSVAAQQINIVFTAKRERRTDFIFSDGDTVSLNPEFGIFITMNPGYAGRQELPENLKMMFRTVAMMVPDRQIIIRVKLASCGFKNNVTLSRKFYTLYKLCEEQLSKQIHYDFGLRNILSVLRTLGDQKRVYPGNTEETIVMRVLKDMNVSKLVDEDEPLFMSLINDMFPNIKLTQSLKKDLQKSIDISANELGLINNPEWNLKIIQLYETSLVRHGLMIMGPTGSGKTSCIQTLLSSFMKMGASYKEIRMNPKAITASQMFGRLDVATNDWTDGIFSTLWRKTLKMKKNEYCWLILDGPVDAVWIENLNSVLDDNKTLTLANGDRIKMSENCKLVFEPDNVDNASPATISRMGMVYMSSSVLGWETILDGWLKIYSQNSGKIKEFFLKIYNDAYTFLVNKLVANMHLLEALYIKQCLDIFHAILQDHGIISDIYVFTLKVENHNLKGKCSDTHLERLFLFAVMWSLGAVLELEERDKLEHYLLNHQSKMNWPKKQPSETIYEYYVDNNGNWLHWKTQIEHFSYPQDSVLEFASILVPNVDNIRTTYLIKAISTKNKPVLLIGGQGTAKTVLIKGYMSQYNPEENISKALNFSSTTTPNSFQRIIESYVEKRVGTTYGPPGQRKMTIFIDDINMPSINEWGDQITNESVRQLLEQVGLYSLDKPGVFLSIVDILLLAAMINPGGGRNDIPNRLKRHFTILNCTLPSNNSMDMIFKKIGEGYFSNTRFDEIIVNFIPTLIPMTRILWQHVKAKMLPTPANFHYIFNLRDLSRIWEGLLKIKGPECTTVKDVIRLWRHECTRILADRFVNFEDKTWFYNQMREAAEDILLDQFSDYDDEDIYFVDFLRDIEENSNSQEDVSLEPPKVYEAVSSLDIVKEKAIWYMKQFNEHVRGTTLDLVFYRDALIHLIIISRIIRTPRGNALLVAVGGSGKQSLTKLSSFIAGYTFYQITLTRAYNAGNFLDDLKYLYRISGLEGQGITFIFTENDIKDESFLEYLNSILSCGEVPNLFSKEELDEILNEIAPIMRKFDSKRPPTQDNLYDFFISRARSNLHIVICFSPAGDTFRTRALKFPGLISGCTIDWFQKWPEDARLAVSRHYLENFEILCNAESRDHLVQVFSFIHEYVSSACESYYEKFRRKIFVTPRSLVSFLQSYKEIYLDKRSNISLMADRMTTGLQKLQDAAASVETLKLELAEKNKQIAITSAEANKFLEEVAKTTADAEIVQNQVSEIKVRAEVLVEQITADKKIAENKLELARPALEEAENALKTIKSTDIATVRRLAKPPFLITLIMDCVSILFQKKIELVKPDYETQFLKPSWSESLKVMADTRFLQKILEYPVDKINGEMVDLLKPYFNYSSYTFESAKIACGNVAGLLSWTIAMAKYYEVNREVLPLKANLAKQEIKYRKAFIELQEAEDIFTAKEDELNRSKKVFDDAMEESKIVMEEARICQNKMDAATALIEGLIDERARWTEQLLQFNNEEIRLVGDVILLASFLSYTGPFNQEYRNQLRSVWFKEILSRRIPISININLIDSLTDSVQIGEWNIQGLPTDELSIQNGIIATKAARYPLLIDPQSQGKFWIKNKEKTSNLIITYLEDKNFRIHIETSISMGYPLLIEDVGEDLDPCLNNILDKNLIKIGTSYKVKVGDKEVDYDNNFRMYITTKFSNPAFAPEICARTSIIDFTVTMKGLEDQLLGRVIMTEKQELEEERTKLLENITTNMKMLQELEGNLLHKLSTTQGSLLDDLTVMEVLNVSKETAIAVKKNLQISQITESKINSAREEFRPVATRGSVLYFLICTMSLVNVMYQTSLTQFLERFDFAMKNSTKHPVTQKRIKEIIHFLTLTIYKYKSRELYENHKYLFVLLMAINIDLTAGNISYEEFQFFIKGGAALNLTNCSEKPFKWISDEIWLNVNKLGTLRIFVKLIDNINESERQWKIWYQKDNPEKEINFENYKNVNQFRKLLLIRAWCPDRIIAQSRNYISQSLGLMFTETVIVNFDEILSETHPLTPSICFLSMGCDPTSIIESLAKRNEIMCHSISMGQGQEILARKLVSTCIMKGCWILLQNCHLGLDYMNELAILLQDLIIKGEGFHKNFRIWITTEIHKDFPINLLQLSLKFTNEAPSGVKAGLKRTYANVSQDFLDHNENPIYYPMVFSVSFLYTIIQERRKFGALGWNIPYEFNSADWLASCMYIQNFLDEIDPKKNIINWASIRYMLGEIQYGGRVTDDFDKRLLNTFVKVWFCAGILDVDFSFSQGYPILKYRLQEEYLDSIEEWPVADSPTVYGLHANADIIYNTNMSKEILDTIISVQPKETAIGSEESRDSIVGRLIKDLLQKLPQSYNIFEIKKRLQIMGQLNPMNIFLRQEIERMQKVISGVHESLESLLLAIEGSIIMTDQLQDLFNSLFDAKVPIIWMRDSWQSSTLGFWMTELLERNRQLSKWCFVGRPIVFWMSGFFNAQGFLTAMKQEISRAHKDWSLDQITLFNDVTKLSREECRKIPKEGVLVHGLFLDGAGWDRKNGRLVESTNKILYTEMPVIHIFAVNSNITKNPKLYMCPVYNRIQRTDLNYITSLYLESLKSSDDWILRGVALLCDTK